MFLVTNTINTRLGDNFTVHLNRYLACEASGSGSEKSCDSEQRAYKDAAYPQIIMTSFILSGAFPAVTIVYAVQIEKLKTTLAALLKHLRCRNNSL